MRNALKFYIGGEWIEPAQKNYLDVINPATEESVQRIAMGSAADVDRAVAAASRALEIYENSTRETRLALFDRIIEAYRARAEELADIITEEMGSPAKFARDVHVPMGLAHFVQTRAVLKDYRFDYMLEDNRIRREAFGVCGLITAWNWPVGLIAAKLAGALAAGCCVVLKPSELSPLSAIILAEIMDDAGVPPGVFNLVNGDGPTVGHAMSTHPDIAMVSFTGSVRAGIEIAKAAASTVKSVHQELGGKSANIIMPDADLSVAIPDAVRRAFINSGQSCIAPTRLLVRADKISDAVQIARSTAEAMKVGNPLSPETTLGPIANAAQHGRILRMIQAGIDEGATLVCGGPEMPDGLSRGYYVRPTIFSGVTPQMRIAKEEIFGPVLSIMSYTDEADAIDTANNSPFGLAGYVFSTDLAAAHRVANRIKAGRVFVNGAPTNATAPFGGYKQSGNGREVGLFGLEAFLEVKAVIGPQDAARII